MFRRRRREAGDETGPDLPGAQQPHAGQAGEAAAGQGTRTGPWDSGEDVPARDRIDFGSLQVPAADGVEVQVSIADDQPAWVTVIRGDSGLQLQAFAAPKSGGLWDDVRAEIAAEVAKAGGQSEEAEGPFGTELRARIAPGAAGAGGGRGRPQPVRFLGVDGPRWFLRGVISGPAAHRGDIAAPLEQVFADVVVVRGSHPVPPRDMLEIQLPDEAKQALAGQTQQPAEDRWLASPFERGPEITETR